MQIPFETFALRTLLEGVEVFASPLAARGLLESGLVTRDRSGRLTLTALGKSRAGNLGNLGARPQFLKADGVNGRGLVINAVPPELFA